MELKAGTRLAIRVIPSAKEQRLVEEKGMVRIYLQAPPDKGKANRELLKFFKKEQGVSVRLVSGEKSRRKVIEVVGRDFG